MQAARAAGLCLVVLALAATGFAQTQITTGVIQGTVFDQSGAVLQGAGVEAKEPATNLSKSQNTDANGRFTFLALPPGRYTLTISHSGFSTIVQENLNLTVGQAINLNFSMKVSATAERIVVTETPTVDTTETANASTLNETTVSTTPILGRKFEDLLTLTPGVSIVQGPDGDEITFAGQRGIFNNISLDGGDYNNGFFGEQMGGQRAAIDITLDAVKEFQVVANGANAEFGRTAGGVVNVITKSGTNDVHGSAYEFLRHKALSSSTSDGKALDGFYRDQFGGTIGGPIVKDKMFFFTGVESIFANLRRANLSTPIGPTPCPVVGTPTVPANEAQINANIDCQRLALIGFMKTSRGQDEGLPVLHPIRNTAVLGKWDWNVSPKHLLGVSYNFDYSKNDNQTFDVPTYGDSANGTEGPSKIQAINANLFSTLSAKKLNEFHFTYSRENRPRSATPSNIPADTAIGSLGGGSFRFGNPFFLGPTIDELFWRTQLRDNLSIVHGNHNIKFGGEWLHSRNVQVFRGFFEGRYIFGSVDGFLRYASAAAPGGFGPNTAGCSDGSFVTSPTTCPVGTTSTGSPLLLFLQGAGLTGPATDAAGFSDIVNEDFALFIQDSWKVTPHLTVNYGLRWEAQTFPKPVIPPAKTAYGAFLSDPLFPSDGTIHNQWKEFQPRLGISWDVTGRQKSVLRANAGIFYGRQNMLTEVSAITTNGVQQQTIAGGAFANPTILPTWPLLAPVPPVPPGQVAPNFSGVHVFSKDYANPRVYTANLGFEQELASNLSGYVDFTWSKAVHLTSFINGNAAAADGAPGGYFAPNGTFVPQGRYSIQLGDLFIHTPTGKSLYRGFTVGMRKRFSQHFQLEWNYVLSEDLDNDSNERDPFTDRRIVPGVPALDYSFSDRDERHKFNLFSYAELPHGFNLNTRLQAHTPQPITPDPTTTSCPANPLNFCKRNSTWKDNAYISFDWRVMRPFKFGDRYALTPMVEMFNTFNNINNVNTSAAPILFNFDGFLRQGVGDPRQLQVALRFTF